MADPLPFGFDTDASRALAIQSVRDVTTDDETVLETVRQVHAVLDSERQAQLAVEAAGRWRDFPKEDRARLEQDAAKKTADREALAARLRETVARQEAALSTKYATTLNRALARPAGVDPEDDRETLREHRRRFERLDPAVLTLEVQSAARQNQQRDLVRAALGHPTGSLVRGAAEQEAHDWLVAHQDSSLIRDARRIWRLRKIATDLEVAPYDLSRIRG
jgi:hypothetical protein